MGLAVAIDAHAWQEGGFTMIRWKQAWLVGVLVLATGHPAPAQDEGKVVVYRPTRELPRDERLEAIAAREKADRLNAELQAGMRGARQPPNIAALRGRAAALRAANVRPLEEDVRESSIPPAMEAKAQELMDLHQSMIDKYPLTEFGYYGMVHKSGMLQRQGKIGEAAKVLEQAAIDYAGTKEGYEAILSIATFYTQTRSDYERAIQWLELMPNPAAPSPPAEDADRADQAAYRRAVHMLEGQQMDYLNAQQRIIRCELELGRDQDANARRARLKTEFPDYADSIDREFESYLNVRASRQEQELRNARGLNGRP